MRVMIIATSSPESESRSTSPSAEGMEAIGRFHEELAAAGVLLDAGRLQPSSKGARVRFKGASRRVTDGPFLEAKELVGGYWIWQVGSLNEAIDWLKRAPFDAGNFEVREIQTQPTP
ncbi:MAG: YciI family protein [Candidatus Limnocylindria bacterium]